MAINVIDPHPLIPWRTCRVLTVCPLTGNLTDRPGEGLIIEGVIYRRVNAPEAAAYPEVLRDMTLHLFQVAGQRQSAVDGNSEGGKFPSPGGGGRGEGVTVNRRRVISPEPLTLWSV